MLAALDRLDDELGGGEYLVGDRFTVADLTAAALFYPLVPPPGGPAAPRRPARGDSSASGSRSGSGAATATSRRCSAATASRQRSGPELYQPSDPGSPLIGPWISAVIQPP